MKTLRIIIFLAVVILVPALSLTASAASGTITLWSGKLIGPNGSQEYCHNQVVVPGGGYANMCFANFDAGQAAVTVYTTGGTDQKLQTLKTTLTAEINSAVGSNRRTVDASDVARIESAILADPKFIAALTQRVRSAVSH